MKKLIIGLIAGVTLALTFAAPAAMAQATEEITHYDIGLYCYDKVNPEAPASWENSGYQTLVAVKHDSDQDWTVAEKRVLCGVPEETCDALVFKGSQSDWVAYKGEFTFPEHIQYPTDNIGWPPIYNAVHTDLAQTLSDDCTPPDPHDPISEHKTVSVASCDGIAMDENFTRTQTWDAEAQAYGEFSEWVSDGPAVPRAATPGELAQLTDCPTEDCPEGDKSLACTGSEYDRLLYAGGATGIIGTILVLIARRRFA